MNKISGPKSACSEIYRGEADKVEAAPDHNEAKRNRARMK